MMAEEALLLVSFGYILTAGVIECLLPGLGHAMILTAALASMVWSIWRSCGVTFLGSFFVVALLTAPLWGGI